MRLVITCNGPGETAGWLRPLLREVYALDPQADVHVFYVPDDYATGAEPRVVRELFPQAHVYDPNTYVKTALGARPEGVPEGAEIVLYLGGDLMHAARLHKRFGGAFATYKFSRPRYARETARAYAVDSRNADQLIEWQVPDDRIEIAGNLAIDGALIEVQSEPDPGTPSESIIFMPGSRPYEVEHLVPFFFTAALAIRREDPSVPIVFGISPFTDNSELRKAVETGGDPRFFARKGTLVEHDGRTYLASTDGQTEFPAVRTALASARAARLAVTIPGTKVIELASIGVPVVSCTPENAPELAAINGPLTYLNRIPLIGVPAKRAIVLAYSRKHEYHTQPNIDAQRSLVCELHGALMPGRVARVAIERYRDESWRRETSQALASLYREQVGAAARMARSLMEISGR